jgi:hypothetical protein
MIRGSGLCSEGCNFFLAGANLFVADRLNGFREEGILSETPIDAFYFLRIGFS